MPSFALLISAIPEGEAKCKKATVTSCLSFVISPLTQAITARLNSMAELSEINTGLDSWVQEVKKLEDLLEAQGILLISADVSGKRKSRKQNTSKSKKEEPKYNLIDFIDEYVNSDRAQFRRGHIKNGSLTRSVTKVKKPIYIPLNPLPGEILIGILIKSIGCK